MGRHAGFTVSPETREKISASKKGTVFSEDHRKKLSERVANYWSNLEFREAQSIKIRANFSNPEFMEKFKKSLVGKPRGKDKGIRGDAQPKYSKIKWNEPDQYGVIRRMEA